MKIKDLIKKLNEFNQELSVVIDGYEDGVDDISCIEEIKITLNVYHDDWLGRHEESDNGKVKAIKIT